MKHSLVACTGCTAVYLKSPWYDDDAAYGEGVAMCEACGAELDRWKGHEPYYRLLYVDRNSPNFS